MVCTGDDIKVVCFKKFTPFIYADDIVMILV